MSLFFNRIWALGFGAGARWARLLNRDPFWLAVWLSWGSLWLTQCASVDRSRAGQSQEVTSRVQVLQQWGYEPLPMQRLRGDERFSREFLVNGRAMRLLIDSGANSTDLDEQTARSAGVEPLDSVSVTSRGALGRSLKGSMGVGSLQVGPVYAESFAFTLSDLRSQQTATSRYDGQIGLDALVGMGALVDLPTRFFWVPGPDAGSGHRGEEITPLGRRAELGLGLPLHQAGRFAHIILRGKVAGRSVSWVIDTGAEVSVLASEVFDELGLPSVATDARILDAAGDRIDMRLASLPVVRFGELEVREFEVAVASLREVRAVLRDSRGQPVDGILGMDFLLEAGALLDAGSGVLYVGF